MIPVRGVLEVNTQDGLLAQHMLLIRQVKALTKEVTDLPQQLMQQPTTSTSKFKGFTCESCG